MVSVAAMVRRPVSTSLRDIAVCAFGVSMALVPSSARAESGTGRRLALLVANKDYAPALGRLVNPVHDVELISEALRRVGFRREDIEVVKNTSRRALLLAVSRHAQRIKNAGEGALGFFYYSGHGLANEVDNRNYLIPTSVKKLDDYEWIDAVALDEVVRQLDMTAGNAVHFVVFDACRNFFRTKGIGGKGFVATRGRRGMLIAFSSEPGQRAADEGEGSGPYAAALAAEIVKPGLDHLGVFKNVRKRVYTQTKVQVPWIRDGIINEVYFGGRERRPDDEVKKAWSVVKGSNDPDAFEVFARRYPWTFFADIARAKSKKLRSGVTSTNEAPRRRSLAQDRASITWIYSRPAGVSLSKTEVTVAQFEACLEAGACEATTLGSGKYCNRGKSNREDHPINCVSWAGADSFCRWRGGRLPTEDEWYAEASNAGSRMYPWGEDNATCKFTVMKGGNDGCGKDHTWPVCSKSPGNSISGLCDMSGNVWEWTSSEQGSRRVVRGGSWINGFQIAVRASARLRSPPSNHYYPVGFRCARSFPQ